MAGMPTSVVARAETVLCDLESDRKPSIAGKRAIEQSTPEIRDQKSVKVSEPKTKTLSLF
jgi:hypothetical protein